MLYDPLRFNPAVLGSRMSVMEKGCDRKGARPSWGGAICLALLVLAVQSQVGAGEDAKRDRYEIEVDLDYGRAQFQARQVFHWTNETGSAVDFLTFHLYPNVGISEKDEPLLAIREVSCPTMPVKYSIRGRHTQLRVEFGEKVQPGQRVELHFDFAGRIPRLQREETSLLAHFLQEVNDALDETHDPMDARDIYFAGEESILLGYFYPLLAPRPLSLQEYQFPVGVSGVVFAEIADYRVKVTTEANLTVISSGKQVGASNADGVKRVAYRFSGDSRRGFALAIAEKLKSLEQQVGQTTVVSYYREGDQRLGQRVLSIAAGALQVYRKSYGEYPYDLLQLIELPLAAGYSGIEFPTLIVLPQAYYVDFDAPEAARLPGVLREQSDVIKSSFEFIIAHGVAHQWWGGVVGADPERSPFVDEAMANFSAAYYHEVAYGKQLGDLILKRQVRGAYQAYRMLGGVDQEVDRPLKDFRSGLEFSAIVQAKGALLLVALRELLGDASFFAALRNYYRDHSFRITNAEIWRQSLIGATGDSRQVRALLQRWLKEKHGDEDIGTPDLSLVPAPVSKIRSLGRVFLKIGKTAARPF